MCGMMFPGTMVKGRAVNGMGQASVLVTSASVSNEIDRSELPLEEHDERRI
jgi:hypothetical protein